MANLGDDTDSLIAYCTNFQSQGYEELAARVKDSLRQLADLWTKALPPRVMDLKELVRKSNAAGLKDVAAFVVAMMAKQLTEVIPDNLSLDCSLNVSQTSRLLSGHGHSSGSGYGSQASQMASVYSTDLVDGNGCVLQRFWLCVLKHVRNGCGRTSNVKQPVRDRRKIRDYLAIDCIEMPLLEGPVQFLIDSTFQCWGNAVDSLPASVPNALQVQAVVHVEKRRIYSQFIAKRADISEVLHLCPAKPFTVRTPVITEGINEHWLWHGTTPEAAKGIINRGFDLSRAGSVRGSLYGKGICFAESSMKADFYAKEPDERGWYVLLLCRVVLGRVLYCDDAAPDAEELENKCAVGRACHAVVGDREKVSGSFREVVVFDEKQIYPEYMVWYTRT